MTAWIRRGDGGEALLPVGVGVRIRRAGVELEEPTPQQVPGRLLPHCGRPWVVDPPGFPGRGPGLVLQWALTDADRWAGRAVFAVDTGDHAGLIELWLDQAHLTRAKVIDD